MNGHRRSDASDLPFQQGETVVYPGFGISQLEGTERRGTKTYVRVRVVESQILIGVPVGKARRVLRRPASSQEAQRMLDILRDRSSKPEEAQATYRFRDSQRILARGSLEAQVLALHRKYRSSYRPSFGEKNLIQTFESAILGEIGHVLGLDKDKLAAELHGVHPTFSATAPAPPADVEAENRGPELPQALRGYELLGEFQVTRGKIVIGEAARSSQPVGVSERTGVSAPAVNGVWYAFVEGGDDDEALVAVHSEHVADLRKLSRDVRELGRVLFEHGVVTILDSAVRDDRAYVSEALSPLFTDGLVRDRGCYCRTSANGVFPVRGSFEGTDLVFVSVSFDPSAVLAT